MKPASEIIEMISEQFPDMSMTCEKTKIMQGFECISAYAKELLRSGDDAKFNEFLNAVDRCYNIGDGNVRTGIDNVLLYNLGTYIDCISDRQHTRDILPPRMRSVVSAQYGACAI